MPTWSPGPTPWPARWWASRLARASISAYVRRLPSATRYSRSPNASTAPSKRSARLNSTAESRTRYASAVQKVLGGRVGSTEHLTVERDDGVVVLTMNRPEAKNALSPAMLVGMADTWVEIDE